MRYAIGIDLGGTNIAAGIVTEDYAVGKGSVHEAQRPWQEVAADSPPGDGTCGKGGPFRADWWASAWAARASADGDTGEVVYSNNLYWDDVPFAPP
ncbi:MAG: hypothetical protein ACLRZH_14430 [Ruthenibacterium lactatiformans]